MNAHLRLTMSRETRADFPRSFAEFAQKPNVSKAMFESFPSSVLASSDCSDLSPLSKGLGSHINLQVPLVSTFCCAFAQPVV